jgi:hypothetical protein
MTDPLMVREVLGIARDFAEILAILAGLAVFVRR